MKNWESKARKYAKKHGISPDIFVRQIAAESGGDENAGSSAGAIGIAQFMPATARGLGIDPRDPEQSLDGAARLMSQYVHQYGNYRDALVAYNAGPGRVGKPLYAETSNYVKKILNGKNPTSTQKVSESKPKTVSTQKSTPAAQKLGLDNKEGVRQALIDALSNRSKHPLQDAVGAVKAGKYDSVQAPSDDKAADKKSSNKKAAGDIAKDPGSAGGTANFEGHKVAAWMIPALKFAREQGWRGSINSGVRTTEEQAVLYQRYKAGGNIAAAPGHSNHEEQNGGAIDVGDPEGLYTVLKQFHGRKPIWAKTVGLNDAVHFSSNGR